MKFYMELNKGVIFRNPRAWLYKVYLNQLRTHCNSRENESGNIETRMNRGDLSADLSEEFAKEEKRRIVFEMLNEMSDKERAILLLYNQGFSYAEMADVLEINPNSVGTTLVRAINRLKETLKIHYYEMFEQN